MTAPNPPDRRHSTQAATPVAIADADFFAFRSPLLPFDDFLAWSDAAPLVFATSDDGAFSEVVDRQRALLRERLRGVYAKLELQEALFLASPGLFDSYQGWLDAPESERGQKTERALVRYFARLCARPTPFGLFAGVSVGLVGDESRLELGPRGAYQRHSRLDMHYVCELTEALLREPAIRNDTRYFPNSSLYRSAGRLRYIETRLGSEGRAHHLVAVESSDPLDLLLCAAQEGRTPGELSASLAARDASISVEEATAFVHEVIDSQLLVASLEPAPTGGSPLSVLIDRLSQLPAGQPAAGVLREVEAALSRLDAVPIGSPPQAYRDLAGQLGPLPATADAAHLVQVDMFKPAPHASLSPALIAEIAQGVSILHRLAASSRASSLVRFRERFHDRYGDGEVPLVEALDEESGIGFWLHSAPAAHTSPLLSGMQLSPAGSESIGDAWERRWSFLIGKVYRELAAGETELRLQEEDLKKLEVAHRLPLPDTFGVVACVAAASPEAVARGDYQIELQGIGGPSGVYLLGRFCHLDADLEARVKAHLRREEACRPGAIHAEIVHMPEGRTGNVISRPLLRSHEIPFLGRSGVPLDSQIPITDLLVSVLGDRIVLRSARLGCEVLPRLTSAHNFQSRKSLGTYQFLGLLQSQGVAQFRWDWGPLENLPFLPRVTAGKVVLSLAHWWLGDGDIARLAGAKSAAQRLHLVQALRRERRLPRIVAVSEGAEKLTVDLENSLCVDSFVQLIKDSPRAVLFEQFPAPDQLFMRGPEGRFIHQLNIPMVTRAAPGPPAEPTPLARPAVLPQSSVIAASGRRFGPGSDWLYAKLYSGTATADAVLSSVIAPVVAGAIRGAAADSWFFLRYGDPEWHVRVRFRGEPGRLLAEVLPALRRAVAPLLEAGQVWRFQLDTYDREVSRYGGPLGVDLAERFFHVDSEAVLALLGGLVGDGAADNRWRLTLLGIDMLLADLGFDDAASLELMTLLRRSFGREFGGGVHIDKQLGDRFRRERPTLERFLERARSDEPSSWQQLEILTRRSRRLAPVFSELKSAQAQGQVGRSLPELASSFIHMHANRMLRAAAREHELVIYDFLARIYQSRLTTSRQGLVKTTQQTGRAVLLSTSDSPLLRAARSDALPPATPRVSSSERSRIVSLLRDSFFNFMSCPFMDWLSGFASANFPSPSAPPRRRR